MITQLTGDQKVHYPLPLNLIETDKPHTVDRETMKLMIARMARTFQAASNPANESGYSDRLSQTGSSFNDKFVTARSFFSKENQNHPTVKENLKLKKRLEMVQKI